MHSETGAGIITTVFGINAVCRVITFADHLIFQRITFSGVLMIYVPLNMARMVMPPWLGGILGYAAAPFCVLHVEYISCRYNLKIRKISVIIYLGKLQTADYYFRIGEDHYV